MKPLRVVIDTNVLVAALKSKRGASFALLQRLGGPHFIPLLSPPLCVGYEDVLTRPGMIPGFTTVDAGEPDPKDDLVLEVALAGGASHIVTHNTRDFAGAERLSITVVTPDQFLKHLPTS
jgi:predicted nucleic acid-binding protein